LKAETTIATNIKATNVTVKGDSSTGTAINSGAALTVGSASGNSIVVPADGSIVAGGTTNKVTITGATLKAGTYTALDNASATLTLAGNTEIEVADGGSVAIGTAGQIVFTDGASKISLLAGGSLTSSAAGTLIKATESNSNNVELSVMAAGAATSAKVDTVGTVYTVTTATPGTAGSIIVGNAKWETATNSTAISGQKATTPTAGAGTLKAGEGTTLILAAAA
jgi:hypothetical protein